MYGLSWLWSELHSSDETNQHFWWNSSSSSFFVWRRQKMIKTHLVYLLIIVIGNFHMQNFFFNYMSSYCEREMFDYQTSSHSSVYESSIGEFSFPIHETNDASRVIFFLHDHVESVLIFNLNNPHWVDWWCEVTQEGWNFATSLCFRLISPTTSNDFQVNRFNFKVFLNELKRIFFSSIKLFRFCSKNCYESLAPRADNSLLLIISPKNWITELLFCWSIEWEFFHPPSKLRHEWLLKIS